MCYYKKKSVIFVFLFKYGFCFECFGVKGCDIYILGVEGILRMFCICFFKRVKIIWYDVFFF